MKKLFLVLAIGATFAACNTSTTNDTADSVANVQTEAVADSADAMVDSVNAATDATLDSAKQVAEAVKDSVKAAH
ncbi:hypothetical protein ACFSPU_05150 [Haoranjiania flava]|uniref:Lipoprotein n=1 Tax=Haoranjiania flava TaxID=1856322 RepID=A0AAE3IM76_9BACT|nr:hypothetical protein [Haoranjiania flava]MCU7693713.1 hypothetical protein [Haoranjiania flava]